MHGLIMHDGCSAAWLLHGWRRRQTACTERYYYVVVDSCTSSPCVTLPWCDTPLGHSPWPGECHTGPRYMTRRHMLATIVYQYYMYLVGTAAAAGAAAEARVDF